MGFSKTFNYVRKHEKAIAAFEKKIQDDLAIKKSLITIEGLKIEQTKIKKTIQCEQVKKKLEYGLEAKKKTLAQGSVKDYSEWHEQVMNSINRDANSGKLTLDDYNALIKKLEVTAENGETAVVNMSQSQFNPTADNPTTDNPTADNPTTDNPTADNPAGNPTAPSHSLRELFLGLGTLFSGVAALVTSGIGLYEFINNSGLTPGTGQSQIESESFEPSPKSTVPLEPSNSKSSVPLEPSSSKSSVPSEASNSKSSVPSEAQSGDEKNKTRRGFWFFRF